MARAIDGGGLQVTAYPPLFPFLVPFWVASRGLIQDYGRGRSLVAYLRPRVCLLIHS